jgi:hypothetical protein
MEILSSVGLLYTLFLIYLILSPLGEKSCSSDTMLFASSSRRIKFSVLLAYVLLWELVMISVISCFVSFDASLFMVDSRYASSSLIFRMSAISDFSVFKKSRQSSNLSFMIYSMRRYTSFRFSLEMASAKSFKLDSFIFRSL